MADLRIDGEELFKPQSVSLHDAPYISGVMHGVASITSLPRFGLQVNRISMQVRNDGPDINIAFRYNGSCGFNAQMTGDSGNGGARSIKQADNQIGVLIQLGGIPTRPCGRGRYSSRSCVRAGFPPNSQPATSAKMPSINY